MAARMCVTAGVCVCILLDLYIVCRKFSWKIASDRRNGVQFLGVYQLADSQYYIHLEQRRLWSFPYRKISLKFILSSFFNLIVVQLLNL